jgi:hypothetical protein
MAGYKISSGVGYRKANHKADVAFIQMALKLAPQGGYATGSFSGYWPDRIDGVNSIKLLNAITRFKADYFSDVELGKGSLLRETLSSFPSATSISFQKLTSTLPSGYSNTDFVIEEFGKRVFIFKVNKNIVGPTKYSVENLSLPNDDATALIENLKFISKSFSILPRIKEINLTYNGRFAVNIGLDAGQIVDPETAKIMTVTDQLKSSVIKFMAMRLNKPLLPGSRRWSAIGKQNLLLRTKKQYPKLRASAGARTWQVWHLGEHKTRMQASVVEKVLDAYELHRLGGVLDPETVKFMQQTLGDDWAKVKEIVRIKERKAFAFKRALETALYKRDRYYRLLIKAENDLRRQLGMEEVDVWGKLALDLLKGMGTKKVKKGLAKRLAKSGDGTKEAKELSEEVVDLVAEPIGRAESIIKKTKQPDTPEELEILPEVQDVLASPVLDIVLGVLTVVGIILVVIGAVVGSGPLLVLAAVGRAIKLIVEIADTSIMVLDVVFAHLQNEKLRELVSLTKENIVKYKPLLAEAIRDVQNAVAAIESEDILSLPDFKFSQSEIKEAQSQNAKILIGLAS